MVGWFTADGSQFDLLLEDGQTVEAGAIKIKTIYTPGHTPACATFMIDGAAFAGDAIFMPDSGTGRCDFPAGSAATLYDSISQKLYSLPDATPVYVGHDYQPNGREMKFQTTIGELKQSNIHLKSTTPKEEYVRFREERDKTLTAPKLLLPSIQVNINAGHLPPPDLNGTRYLKMPIRGAQ
jgi:glyoxylase-like metal-dependent hydrolase (beta-lactamase superfamily II)